MNHVTERIADYISNRLTPDERREVEMHADGCGDCRAELAFAMKLRDEALAQGVAHIAPDRIIAISADRGAATAAEHRHLEACDGCRAEVAWAESAGGEDALSGEDTEPESRRRLAPSSARRWWPVGAVALAAVIATLIFLPRAPRDTVAPVPRDLQETTDHSLLARIEPLPVRISRGVAEADSFETARLRGLELYRDADYGGARAAFGDALALKPGDPEMLLYLGSSEAMAGHLEDAAVHLEGALDGAEAPALREEILWQLANAKLALNKSDEATRLLEQVIAIDGRHVDPARRLLTEMRK